MLDNCTDDTKAVLNKIHDPRVNIYESQEQLGVHRGLNVLLSKARGKYIARMDADDVSLPWRFKSQLKAVRRIGCDFLFSNAIIFGKSVLPFGFLPQLPFRLMPDLAPYSLIVANPFVHPSMLAKASALRSLKGYRDSSAEDYELWIRASIEGFTLAKVGSYSLLYRVHKNQLTQQDSWKRKLAQDQLLENSRNILFEVLFGKEPNFKDLSARKSRTVVAFIMKQNFKSRLRLVGIIGLRELLPSFRLAKTEASNND